MATSTSKYISKLQGQRVLVIGGASGIGFCIAEAALEHGAHVVVGGHTEAKLSRALERLRQGISASPKADKDTESRVKGMTCDLADQDTVEANLDALLRFATSDGAHKLDHIAFTAGEPPNVVPISDITPAAVASFMAVRFIGTIMLAKLLPRYALSGVSTSLTLTGGAVAHKPIPGWAAMAGIASGVEGLIRGLAVDLKPIRVNLVSPGSVLTEMWGSIPQDHLEGMLEAVKKQSLTGTVGKPEDVAEAYIYCMKDHFVTGTVVGSNGGRLLV